MADTDPLAPVAQLLKQLIEAAKKVREPFLKVRKDLYEFAYSAEYDFLYKAVEQNMFFKAKVNKAAEFLEIMGASLCPTNPVAAVNSYDWATPSQRQRHKLEEQYLEYANTFGGLHTHTRRWVTEGLLSGRGVLWTGYNARKGIVQSVYDEVDNLLVDPDARIFDEANWIARIRRKPRWFVLQMFPEAAEKIKKIEATTAKSPSSAKTMDPAADIIEYYEFYFKAPPVNYAPGHLGNAAVEDPVWQRMQSIEQPKIVLAGDCILSVEPWEIPWYTPGVDSWPCELLDFRERPDSIWPQAPMECGLGHIRALNWIYTLYISKMRFTTRTPLVVAKYNGQGLSDDEAVKLLKGDDMDLIRITINGNENLKLSDFVQQFKFESGVEELERFNNIVGKEFEKSTGLYEVLYTGTTPTQIRNAATADMIRNSSQSRVEDMRAVLQSAMSRLFQKELFAARYLHDPQEIAKLFGPQAGALWGTLAAPQQVQQEQQMRAQTKQQIVQQFSAAGMPPQQAESEANAALGPEQLVSLEDWVHEAGREVVGGSMRPSSVETQLANLNVALNQLTPSVVNLPGGAEFVAAVAKEFVVLNRFSPELRDAAAKFAAQATQVTDMQVMVASQPPPPPQAGPSGGDNPANRNGGNTPTGGK